MLLCPNEVFLACSMSKGESEGAISGMWHWRVGSDIHRESQQILSRKSGQNHEKSVATGTVHLSTDVTLSVLVS